MIVVHVLLGLQQSYVRKLWWDEYDFFTFNQRISIQVLNMIIILLRITFS